MNFLEGGGEVLNQMNRVKENLKTANEMLIIQGKK